jgi:hypothetical protein
VSRDAEERKTALFLAVLLCLEPSLVLWYDRHQR